MNIFSRLKNKIRQIAGMSSTASYYEQMDYLEAYSKHTNDRVEKDPKTAIGVEWDKIGMLQKVFLIEKGLNPHNTILDYGCGTLRAGQHLIEYLNTGNYTGIDISEKVIDHAEDFVKKEAKLKKKKPVLIWNESMSLDFDMFKDNKFDYIMAQSVFTHLKPKHCEVIIENIKKIMHEDSRFYFTIFMNKEYRELNKKDFEYPFEFFEDLAIKNGYKILDESKHYDHPKNQKMLVLMLND